MIKTIQGVLARRLLGSWLLWLDVLHQDMLAEDYDTVEQKILDMRIETMRTLRIQGRLHP